MDTEATHVLLVGGTGRFGHRLAAALLSRPGIHLHVLVRPGTRPESLDGLADQGVTLVEGSLQDARSLESAVEGMDAVVSAVRGGPDVVLDGQARLLDAARRHGVVRFIPSDYCPDYFQLREGEDAQLDWRRRIAGAVEQSGMRYTLIFCGAFMEVALSPAAHVFDLERGRVAYWGTGDEPFDVSAMSDVARWVAQAVVDRRAENQRLELVGDVVTVNEVIRLYEALTGRQLQRIRRGSVEELRRSLARTRTPEDSVREGLVQPHLLLQLAGRGRLRHPNTLELSRRRPLTVREYLEANLRPWSAAHAEASPPAHP